MPAAVHPNAPPAAAPSNAPATTKANNAANAKWAAQRAEVKRETALKTPATNRGNNATNTAPNRTAETASAQQSMAKVTIRSASCTTIAPGEYRVNIAGDAFAPAGETYLFYTWAAAGANGTRWRPVCRSWSTPQASDGNLWDVTCIHRPNDPSLTTWETSRTITSKDKQPPTNGGTAIFKPGVQAASTLKFNLTCQ